LHIVHRVIVSIRSGKFLFHDWKSQGKVREFYYARPVGTLEIEYSK